jgi:hypothetical protein
MPRHVSELTPEEYALREARLDDVFEKAAESIRAAHLERRAAVVLADGTSYPRHWLYTAPDGRLI